MPDKRPCNTCRVPPESYLGLTAYRIGCAEQCQYSQKFNPKPESNDNAKTRRLDTYFCRSGFAYPVPGAVMSAIKQFPECQDDDMTTPVMRKMAAKYSREIDNADGSGEK